MPWGPRVTPQRRRSGVPSVALTKTDNAYQQLRARILSGELAPGTSLDQETLAEELGLSTTPVREALRRLESDQLVISRAHRDTVVTPISITLLEEVYAVRLKLDPMAVGLTAEHADASDIAEMQRLLKEDLTGASAADHLYHNRDLHREIYRCCGNSVLVQVLDSLWDLSDRYRMITLKDHTTARSAAAEHAEIVSAIVSRDADEAAYLMREHVKQSLEKIRTASAIIGD